MVALVLLEQEFSKAKVEMELERWRGKRFLFPLVIAGIVAVIMGPLTMGHIIYGNWLFSSSKFYGIAITVLLSILCYGLPGWGLLYAYKYQTRVRKKRQNWSNRQINQVVCQECNASVPIFLGKAVKCPCCQSELFTRPDTAADEKSAAEAEVADSRMQAKQEESRTEALVAKQEVRLEKWLKIGLSKVIEPGVRVGFSDHLNLLMVRRINLPVDAARERQRRKR